MASAEELITYLRSLPAVRERSNKIYDLGKQNKLNHFSIDESKLNEVADFVLNVIKESYPTLDVPFHSRWRHVECGNVNRKQIIEAEWQGVDALEKARRQFDFVVTSVLLDAGAGPTWKYTETLNGQTATFSRSEGLGVASWHLFYNGAFSTNPSNKHQVDGEGLSNLKLETLREGMQVSDSNPLVGLEGRHQLLQRLGNALQSQPNYFKVESSPYARIGHIVDYLLKSNTGSVHIKDLWKVVIDSLQNIWPPTRTVIGGKNMGDVWTHSALPADNGGNYVPFHKLSQWLTYSLLEPLQEYGLKIEGLELMTGLPEYRNGGLFIDLGLLVPKRSEIYTEKHEVHSEVVIEWRALTVALLDVIGDVIRNKLGKTKEEYPLVKILEGGTWKAGRVIARKLRPDGGPPLTVISDGTVF